LARKPIKSADERQRDGCCIAVTTSDGSNNISPRRPDAAASRTPVARKDAATLPTLANCILLRASGTIDQGKENTLSALSTFPTKQVHNVLQKTAADIHSTSGGRDWTSIFASMQREFPFSETF
jgi:hypothetical protein